MRDSAWDKSRSCSARKEGNERARDAGFYAESLKRTRPTRAYTAETGRGICWGLNLPGGQEPLRSAGGSGTVG